jgi:transcriptional regulator with XRE-family HTH domain
MLVNDQIRAIRTEKKISQQEIADFLGISQGTYNRIENGSIELKISDLKKIAEKLEVHASQLLEEESGKPANYNLQRGDNNQNAQNTLTEKERSMFQQVVKTLEDEIIRLHDLLKQTLNK